MEAFDLPFDYDIDLGELIPLAVIGAVQAMKLERGTPRSTGLPGRVYLNEFFQNGTPRRIYDVLRMQKETFFKLCDWLESNTDIESLRYISVQEQVAMFLWTINFSVSNKQVMERFQHSGEIVSR
jgi:hypothetical protein